MSKENVKLKRANDYEGYWIRDDCYDDPVGHWYRCECESLIFMPIDEDLYIHCPYCGKKVIFKDE